MSVFLAWQVSFGQGVGVPGSVVVSGSEVSLHFDAEFSAEQQSVLGLWIERRAKIVANFYDQFPVKRVNLTIQAVSGSGVRGGTTYPRATPVIRLRVGKDFTLDQLNHDWVLVHEMIHLALPSVADQHSWLSEGLATYVESIARVRMSDISREQLWGDFVKDMPQGQPKDGDAGLDNTHTWGRTYWGGAIFCLLADVEIRKLSNNKFALRDALIATLKESGGFVSERTPAQIFAIGDSAIKQDTLSKLYVKSNGKPMAADLEALWRDLGIKVVDAKIEFDDRASLAYIRKAIEQGAATLNAN
jgi:hypothetical protein